MNETTILLRLELYNQVWSKPLIHLAKEYNISDVGPAKICRRHNIPLPPVGYWARKAHGKHTQQIAFVPSQEGEADTIEIMAKTSSAANDVKGMSDDLIVELLGHEFIELKEFKKELRPLARETQKKYLSQLKLYED